MGTARDISKQKRLLLAQFFTHSARNGMLPKAKVDEAIFKFGICKSSIFRMWKRVKLQLQLGLQVSLPTRRRGTLRSTKIELDVEKLKSIPFHKRNIIRNLANNMGVSTSTIFRWKRRGMIRSHSNAIKPALNDLNKITRMKFCLKALSYDAATCKPKFKSMTHDIHVDEKWFNMTACTENYYISPGEPEPHRTCQSKRFITKVMFFCAVCRPIYLPTGELLFDGKLGMWPFTKKEPAKRRSRNRPAGTMVTKPLDSINKEVTKQMMLNHVIPAIKAKWPTTASKDITIQWDNAPPHVGLNVDPEFIVAATEGGFNIKLKFQPPNSPDLNVNDLGWFRSIDSLKTDVQARTVDELVYAVEHSYNKLSHSTLNKVFLTLESCMVNIMKIYGSNDYKITHMGKDALARRGLLPSDCTVDLQLVRQCLLHLMDTGNVGGLEEMMEEFS